MLLKYHTYSKSPIISIMMLLTILQPPISEEVDEVVFGRCCEFVYSGDCSVPLPVSNPSESDGGQPSSNKTLSQQPVER